MENQSKKAWAFPHRSGDVPGASRARIIDFPMVLGSLGGAFDRARISGPLRKVGSVGKEVHVGQKVEWRAHA